MLDKDNIPQHVAIIMGGNGRWAREKSLPRSAGHHRGIQRVKEIIKAAGAIGIKYLTLFAFSAENWKRPKSEVAMLMRALDHFLSHNIERMKKNNMRLAVIGRRRPLPDYLWERLVDSQAATKDCNGLTVVLAFNYGGRAEIIDAAKKMARAALDRKIDPDDISEENFERFLYTAGLPDPDLLIRTSGELRISNFLLWQLSYAELYFSSLCWPDFKREDLEEAIAVYQGRVRRFGGVSPHEARG